MTISSRKCANNLSAKIYIIYINIKLKYITKVTLCPPLISLWGYFSVLHTFLYSFTHVGYLVKIRIADSFLCMYNRFSVAVWIKTQTTTKKNYDNTVTLKLYQMKWKISEQAVYNKNNNNTAKTYILFLILPFLLLFFLFLFFFFMMVGKYIENQ